MSSFLQWILEIGTKRPASGRKNSQPFRMLSLIIVSAPCFH
jgi:hypothetical protein